MKIRETKKSRIYEFDGYSKGYTAFVQGAFVGTFIVPKEVADKYVTDGCELEILRDMHAKGGFRIRLVGKTTIF